MFLPRPLVAALAVLTLAQTALITHLLSRNASARHIAVPACETPFDRPALSDEPCLPPTLSTLQA